MTARTMYIAITQSIQVQVEPSYLEDQSSPPDNHFVWAYRVIISNLGQQTVQLRRRYWKITDGHGMVQEVRGEGVVGEQPVLRPGDSYEYISGTPLSTPGGIMTGRYFMEGPGGEDLSVEIPAFSLDSPYQKTVLN